jgi:hypothetical protein
MGFSSKNREVILTQMKNEQYDVLVIGAASRDPGSPWMPLHAA